MNNKLFNEMKKSQNREAYRFVWKIPVPIRTRANADGAFDQ